MVILDAKVEEGREAGIASGSAPPTSIFLTRWPCGKDHPTRPFGFVLTASRVEASDGN